MARILKPLVRDGQKYSSEYKGTLANHLPMDLFSLYAIGATDDRLQEFSDRYVKRLLLRGAESTEVTQANWKSLLGQHKFHADYLRFFKGESERLGLTALLGAYLPHLMTSPGSGAFHGLLRTAFGVEFRETSEVVEGLAYWCVAFLPPSPQLEFKSWGTKSALEVVQGVLNHPAFAMPPKGPTIVDRMAKLVNRPETAEALMSVAEESAVLSNLAAVALALYGATDSFTLLHGVTGTHSLRVLLPFVSDKRAALWAHWRDLFVAFLTVPLTAVQRETLAKLDLSVLSLDEAPPWDEIKKVGIASDDDHVCKLVYAAMVEEKIYGWPLYRRAAAIKTALSTPLTR